MAKHTIITTVSDLSGTEDAAPVRFGLDGVTYEIDLTDNETDEFRALIGPYTQAARRTGGRRVKTRHRK